MTIYEKLAYIQQALRCGKDEYNQFGRFAYRTAEKILEVAKPICYEAKTTLTLDGTVEMIGGNIYQIATATLTDWSEPCPSVQVKACIREAMDKKGMDPSQMSGAAISYARKYALGALFNIDDGKDADSVNNAPQNGDYEPKQATRQERPVENPGDYIFDGGQYKGKTINEVYMENQGYIEWYHHSGRPGKAKDAIDKYFEYMYGSKQAPGAKKDLPEFKVNVDELKDEGDLPW